MAIAKDLVNKPLYRTFHKNKNNDKKSNLDTCVGICNSSMVKFKKKDNKKYKIE